MDETLNSRSINNIPSGRLPFSTKLAYASGGGGEALPFNLFAIYFIFVLTDVIGFSPMWAGIISSVGLVWDAVAQPLIGYLSDRNTSKMGRRRSFMAVGFVPLSVCIFLLFLPNGLTGTLQVAYYFIIVLALYFFETMYVIPYYSLCPELTTDYAERNNIRTFSMWINYGLLIVGTSGPMYILSRTLDGGGTEKQAWGNTGAVFGALTILVCGICLYTTRGKGVVITKDELANTNRPNFFKTIAQLFKLKVYRMIIFMTISWSINVSLFLGMVTFLLTYVTKAGPGLQSLWWILYSVFAMITLPIVAKLAGKYGKKEVLTVILILLILNAVIFSFIGMDSYIAAVVWTFMSACGISTFFTYCISIAFEVAEIHEFNQGERAEGQLLSMVNFSRKCGAAIGTFIIGAWLTYINYDANLAEQTLETQRGLVQGLTLVPIIFFGLALLFLFLNPLKKAAYELLLAALIKKRAGETVSADGFEKIIK